ncbi:trp operon repressor [Ferrimonas aestuarii]|uniref:Trp operon repressor homolog n=1 Tax=Ferrimonas aestuarii TaxID=2569539 RepID=A0A4V5NWE9_9GAMM|nr:trp operon repressor [Ferrimonas aestuarii]TKB55328.1 trp operon repressor [Ferrimonas aestuarii]
MKESDYWDKALGLIVDQEGKDSASSLFNLLLTVDERDAIGARLAVMRALIQGELTQRQIAEQLNVSIATITRCSNTLKNLQPMERDKLQQQLLSAT